VRIAIVNDSVVAQQTLRNALARAPGHQVVWTARNGAEAVDRCIADRPDVVLMDLFMPVMDGIECTRRIMASAPCAILIVTAAMGGSYTNKVYEAMAMGALDAVNTPIAGPTPDKLDDAGLLKKLETIGKLVSPQPPSAPAGRGRASVADGLPMLCAIGASTGGPQAFVEVLSRLGEGFPAAVVLVQHIDPAFASGLSEWLRQKTGFPVRAARTGDVPEPGVALLAATSDHLVLDRRRQLRYTAEPSRVPYRPSVDVFYGSLAAYWPRRSVAALLTGMGKDGAHGLLRLRDAGWTTIAQDERTSVVYGMPRAAAELKAADHVLPIEQIGPAIAARVRA
jgi:two-component system response regulator WspF